MSRTAPLVSIVVNGRNYDRFLAEAIDSALEQTYPSIEVIVVDDGSTDGSLAVMDGYGQRIRQVHTGGGGQSRAVNQGVAACEGDLLLFLDADDRCAPERAQRLVDLYGMIPTGPAMVCHRLERFGDLPDAVAFDPGGGFRNLDGTSVSGELFAISDPAAAYGRARAKGYIPYLATPTSGLSINRELADVLFPIPEVHPIGADTFVVRGAMLAAPAYGTTEPLGHRRFHGRNLSLGRTALPHLIDEPFLAAMETYLNELLRVQGRDPVISVFESTGALRMYRERADAPQLRRLALSILKRERSWGALKTAARLVRYSVEASRASRGS